MKAENVKGKERPPCGSFHLSGVGIKGRKEGKKDGKTNQHSCFYGVRKWRDGLDKKKKSKNSFAGRGGKIVDEGFGGGKIKGKKTETSFPNEPKVPRGEAVTNRSRNARSAPYRNSASDTQAGLHARAKEMYRIVQQGRECTYGQINSEFIMGRSWGGNRNQLCRGKKIIRRSSHKEKRAPMGAERMNIISQIVTEIGTKSEKARRIEIDARSIEVQLENLNRRNSIKV